jgi:hypothetical protein
MNMNEMTPTQIDTAWLQLHSKSNRLQDFISNKFADDGILRRSPPA